jgi:hypothetical protein
MTTADSLDPAVPHPANGVVAATGRHASRRMTDGSGGRDTTANGTAFAETPAGDVATLEHACHTDDTLVLVPIEVGRGSEVAGGLVDVSGRMAIRARILRRRVAPDGEWRVRLQLL